MPAPPSSASSMAAASTEQTEQSTATSSSSSGSRDSTESMNSSDAAESGSAAGSSSSVERPRVGGQSIRIGDKDRDSSGDSCSFYALETGAKCRKARTCYDCLNTAVSGAQGGCVLTPQGFCQTMDRYDYNSDFRRNFTNVSIANSWYNFYPAINSTYCQPNDAACVRCRQIAGSETTLLQLNSTVNVNSTNTEESRQFCRGADGCVCVVACEYSMWNTTVAEDCPNEAYVPTEVEGYRTYFPLFMILQMVLLGTLLYRRRVVLRNRNRSRAVPAGPYNDVRAISSPSNHLRLSAWTAGRQQQIQREKNPRGYLHLDAPRGIQLAEEGQQAPSDTVAQGLRSEGTEPTGDNTETCDRDVEGSALAILEEPESGDEAVAGDETDAISPKAEKSERA